MSKAPIGARSLRDLWYSCMQPYQDANLGFVF